MTQRPSDSGRNPHHVSLVALPDAVVSTLFGIFDVMNAFAILDMLKTRTGERALFHAEIVGESAGPVTLASGVAVNVQRAIASIDATDIVIVPSVVVRSEGWKKGRYLVSSGASTTWHDLTLYL